MYLYLKRETPSDEWFILNKALILISVHSKTLPACLEFFFKFGILHCH